ncbi:hypothetical protein ADIS_2746 [Lunatimonas lonarensis]|uniref:Uncharacterized protein n=1 Tax=Lunatimonas lonarensis TaxID=1232681 RepID=R7ZRY4_9BACT|nr:hypothetical protein [Lunatimonas lonarensis]EON76875.1 hypothetical protein ADIS_2746 [Lunatimonas lonarensis]
MKDYIKQKSRSPLVYWLNEEDVQNIAREVINRELTPDEIEKIAESLTEYIDWSDAIALAIDQNI